MHDAARRRSDAGILQITDRDILALTWMGEQYAITFEQLRQLLGQHSPTAAIGRGQNLSDPHGGRDDHRGGMDPPSARQQEANAERISRPSRILPNEGVGLSHPLFYWFNSGKDKAEERGR